MDPDKVVGFAVDLVGSASPPGSRVDRGRKGQVGLHGTCLVR